MHSIDRVSFLHRLCPWWDTQGSAQNVQNQSSAQACREFETREPNSSLSCAANVILKQPQFAEALPLAGRCAVAGAMAMAMLEHHKVWTTWAKDLLVKAYNFYGKPIGEKFKSIDEANAIMLFPDLPRKIHEGAGIVMSVREMRNSVLFCDPSPTKDRKDAVGVWNRGDLQVAFTRIFANGTKIGWITRSPQEMETQFKNKPDWIHALTEKDKETLKPYAMGLLRELLQAGKLEMHSYNLDARDNEGRCAHPNPGIAFLLSLKEMPCDLEVVTKNGQMLTLKKGDAISFQFEEECSKIFRESPSFFLHDASHREWTLTIAGEEFRLAHRVLDQSDRFYPDKAFLKTSDEHLDRRYQEGQWTILAHCQSNILRTHVFLAHENIRLGEVVEEPLALIVQDLQAIFKDATKEEIRQYLMANADAYVDSIYIVMLKCHRELSCDVALFKDVARDGLLKEIKERFLQLVEEGIPHLPEKPGICGEVYRRMLEIAKSGKCLETALKGVCVPHLAQSGQVRKGPMIKSR